MTQNDEIDEAVQQVVIDREGRHSLWPQGRTIPAGWVATGFQGGHQTCLDHIGMVWRDQRPLSLREAGHEQR